VGNEFVVTYTFLPANGQMSAGEWSIEVVADQVGEYMTTPQYVSALALGTFTVKSTYLVVEQWVSVHDCLQLLLIIVNSQRR
jgi:hypothetical protein